MNPPFPPPPPPPPQKFAYYSWLQFEADGIADFPADTLDTLENSSPSPLCFSLSRFTLGSHAHGQSALTHRRECFQFAVILGGFHSLEISHSQYAPSTLYISGITCLIPHLTRDCRSYMFPDEHKTDGTAMPSFAIAIMRETAVSQNASYQKSANVSDNLSNG